MPVLLLAAALSLVDVPPYERPVRDSADLLSDSEEREIIALLEQMHATGKVSMAVWVLASTDGEAIEELADRAFRAWRLGARGKDQGLLYLIASADRAARMEVGYGLEGELTDAFTHRLQDETVRPYFRAERYADGIKAAAAGVARKLDIALDLELPAAPAPESSNSRLPPELQMWVLGMFLLPFALMPFMLFQRRLPRAIRVLVIALFPLDIVGLFWLLGFALREPVILMFMGFFTGAAGAIGALGLFKRRVLSALVGFVWFCASLAVALVATSTMVESLSDYLMEGLIEFLPLPIMFVLAILVLIVARAFGWKGGQGGSGDSRGSSGGWSSSSSSSSSGSSFSGGGRSGGGGSTSRW